ncbi:hypothetical protein KIH86_14255 [Paenibacillus sp. HN-1]|uniref:hypothetical protein n=2 Tax=Paenibacillus TaxID=44249 RepID=UPI001CA99D71|nr:hypothetical protein [Paenibacillus sp. CGMCC 1.18879]MBY9080665.1 hypothetical protein [Paenibacillus sp. CGMCC 1.18879]MBY9085390.1 hypothetical protein [Paenibacillus sinensis]
MDRLVMKKILIVALPLFIFVGLITLIHLRTTELNDSWGKVELLEDGRVCLYNGKRYINETEHFTARVLGERLSEAKRVTVYEVPGMNTGSWLAVSSGSEEVLIYKEEHTPDLSLEAFSPTSVEFNGNGQFCRDPSILSAIMDAANKGGPLPQLIQKWLTARTKIAAITSVSLYSDKYPALIYKPF